MQLEITPNSSSNSFENSELAASIRVNIDGHLQIKLLGFQKSSQGNMVGFLCWFDSI
jgi:hypothetical protein